MRYLRILVVVTCVVMFFIVFISKGFSAEKKVVGSKHPNTRAKIAAEIKKQLKERPAKLAAAKKEMEAEMKKLREKDEKAIQAFVDKEDLKLPASAQYKNRKRFEAGKVYRAKIYYIKEKLRPARGVGYANFWVFIKVVGGKEYFKIPKTDKWVENQGQYWVPDIKEAEVKICVD
jgi:hypothetical protein